MSEDEKRRTLRMLQRHSGRLNKMLEDGSYNQLAGSRKRKLVRRAKRAYQSLVGVVSDGRLRRTMAAASILIIGISCSDPGSHGTADSDTDVTPDVSPDLVSDPPEEAGDPAMDETSDPGTDGTPPLVPSFEGPVENPFGLLPPNGYYVWLVFADMDDDGDLDLMAGVYAAYSGSGLYYFENTGSSTAPSFASPVQDPFGFSTAGMTAVPTIGDLDGDGDMDLLAGVLSTTEVWFEYFENTGSATSPTFGTGVRDPFGLAPAGSFNPNPSLTDLDGDGDLDVLSGVAADYSSSIHHYENTGTASSATFGAPATNPFGLSGPTEYTPWLALTDLDQDGDIDLMAGAYGYPTSSGLYYFRNDGTLTEPAFAIPQHDPFGLTTTRYFSSPAFADLDSDGDMDLLVATYRYGDDAIFQYFENTSL